MRLLTLIFTMIVSLTACAESSDSASTAATAATTATPVTTASPTPTPATAATVAPVTIAASTASAVSYIAGKHYTIIETPVPTADASKIEVVEAFWYGCSHCRTFDPLVHAWKAKQAADVKVVLMPAMWNKPMEAHARLFYAAKNLKVEDKIHTPMFDALSAAYHQKNRDAYTELDDIAAFVNTHAAIEVETFKKQYNSFGVTSQVKKAAANARSYKISGTPQMIVDGKYLVTGQSAGGQQGMLDVVDYLVAMIRKARGA